MTDPGRPPRVLFLGHAAERTGPPLVLRDTLRWVRANTEIEMGFALQVGGPLLDDYRALGPTWVVGHGVPPATAQVARAVLHKAHLGAVGDRVAQAGLRWTGRPIGHWPIVYVNTAGCARLLPLMSGPPSRIIAHIHELSTGLDLHLPPELRARLFPAADRVLAVSDAVTYELAAAGLVDPTRVTRVPGCIEPNPPPGPRPITRAELGIPADAFVVGSSGLRHWRKAPDLFVSLAGRLCTGAEDDPYFIWVGGDALEPAGSAGSHDAVEMGLGDRVRFVPHSDHPRDWFRLFDVFALTAREDAFPLVCLEAASVGAPVVCFTSGGIIEFVRDDAGIVVAYPDLGAMAAAISELRLDPGRRRLMGRTGAARVAADHTPEAIGALVAAVIRQVHAS